MRRKIKTLKSIPRQRVDHYEMVTARALKPIYERIISKTAVALRKVEESINLNKLPNIDAIVNENMNDIYANIVAGKMLTGQAILKYLERQLKQTVDAKFFNSEVVPAIEGHTFKIVTTQITPTIADRLKEKIFVGMKRGDSIKKIADSLTMLETNYKTVARTEIHNFANKASFDLAVNETQLLGATQEGRKYWIPSGKETGRETHIQAGRNYPRGAGIPIGQPFIVGGAALMYPGDYAGPPEETINCGCDYAIEFI